MKKPELLVPANSLATLKTAIDAGADAVYFGLKLNSNMRTSNIQISDLPNLKKYKIKKYLTLNSIYYDVQLENLKNVIEKTKDYIDAYICWDLATIQLLKKNNLPFFISTQASISNSESAKFYKELGAKKIVLARELTLEQIKKVKERADIPVEVFIHGSMCMAVSGRCFISQDLFKKSANRGQCLNNCRREYTIKDKQEGGEEMILGDNYILNAKDLCTLPFIEKLIEAGIDSFKIEGRNKKPEYIKAVTEAYREAIDSYYENKLDDKLKEKLMKKLKTVYHREFNQGFFFGKPLDSFSNNTGSKATKSKKFIGKIENYYDKQKVAVFNVQANPIKLKDSLLIIGNKTGTIETTALGLEVEHKKVKEIKKGLVGVKLDSKVRVNDEVYLFEDI
ncbi:MAG: protease [Nanoarchaeota archaeon]|nr:protease [Nanoarchaeota archaeon]